MAWWAKRWLPRAVSAVAGISTIFPSTGPLSGAHFETPRQVFEVLANEWIQHTAPLWGADLTAADLLDSYDASVAAGSW
jgi:methane monooxygenase component A beta chain/propane monooxygenase small subunit